MNERIEITGEGYTALVLARNGRREVWLDSCVPEEKFQEVRRLLERGEIHLPKN